MIILRIAKRKIMKQIFLLLACLSIHQLSAQPAPGHDRDRRIQFPDIPGFQTLVCDFHMHTVFSDGYVWPRIRVQEAVKDGLDAISLTEHLEYQPKQADIPHEDRNRPYQVAEQNARAHDLLVINGSEITRDMPPGHNNAIFLEDANKLLVKDSVEVFREANRQGAFVFWNHPNWIAQTKDGVAKLTEMHEYLIQEGLLHGIEVVNEFTYSDEALQLALDHNLAIMGTSDVHGLIDWDYHVHEGGHRPVNLVFARERSIDSIKDALQKGRTVVWHNNQLIGKEQWLVPLIKSCLEIEKVQYMGAASVVQVFVKNNSDVEFVMMNESNFTLHNGTGLLQILPHATTKIEIKTLEILEYFDLKFRVLNAVTSPNENPFIQLQIKL